MEITDAEAIKQQRLEARRKRDKKRKTVKRSIYGFLAFLAFIIWYGFQPLTAGMEFGICRTFVESRMTFPQTMKIVNYDQFGDSHRVFYTYTNPYGYHRSEMIECVITQDSNRNYVVQDIRLQRGRARESVDRQIVARFQEQVPGIVKYKPNRIIPALPRDDALIHLWQIYN